MPREECQGIRSAGAHADDTNIARRVELVEHGHHVCRVCCKPRLYRGARGSAATAARHRVINGGRTVPIESHIGPVANCRALSDAGRETQSTRSPAAVASLAKSASQTSDAVAKSGGKRTARGKLVSVELSAYSTARPD